MCLIRKTNVTFDIEDPNELKVYEAVQRQPHKQRSRYLLQLAYAGLTNLTDQHDNVLMESIQNDINMILTMIKSGCNISADCNVRDFTGVEDMDSEDDDGINIDEDELSFMLGW